MHNDEWLVLAKVPGDLSAEILRGLFEAQGIPVRLVKEGAASAYGLTVGPFGEAELLVPASLWDAAQDVMDAYLGGEFEAAGEEGGFDQAFLLNELVTIDPSCHGGKESGQCDSGGHITDGFPHVRLPPSKSASFRGPSVGRG